MKLLESTKSGMKKDVNVENQTYLEVTEVVLIYCNIVNNNHQQN